jgi:hypothetical protein
MKTLTIILLAFCYTANCQLTPSDKYTFEQKVISYKSMKSTGGMMAVIGILAGGGGAYLYTQGLKASTSTDIAELESSTQEIVWGSVLIGTGATFLITGLILNSIGDTKMKQYQERLRLGVSIGKVNGLTLCYKF